MTFKVEKLENEKNVPGDAYYIYEEENREKYIVINFPIGDIVQVAYDSLDLFPGSVKFSNKFDSIEYITESNTETNNRFSDSIYFRDILLNHLKNNDMELFALESIRFYKYAVESLKK